MCRDGPCASRSPQPSTNSTATSVHAVSGCESRCLSFRTSTQKASRLKAQRLDGDTARSPPSFRRSREARLLVRDGLGMYDPEAGSATDCIHSIESTVRTNDRSCATCHDVRDSRDTDTASPYRTVAVQITECSLPTPIRKLNFLPQTDSPRTGPSRIRNVVRASQCDTGPTPLTNGARPKPAWALGDQARNRAQR